MNKVQIQFVKDALDQPEKLTPWEFDFINDLADREEFPLSDKQNAVLNRIQRKLD
jgi:hypothetical protein